VNEQRVGLGDSGVKKKTSLRKKSRRKRAKKKSDPVHKLTAKEKPSGAGKEKGGKNVE